MQSHEEAKKKFKHLLLKLVIDPVKGLGATASYDDVFKDYETPKPKEDDSKSDSAGGAGASSKDNEGGKTNTGNGAQSKPGTLFSYPMKKINDAVLQQLMKEAKELNSNKFPAAATFLLRNVVEAILKHIIHEQGANKANNSLSLENCLDICLGNNASLSKEDKKILKEFKNNHLDYLNLGSHGNTVPNYTRLTQVKDCIDQFIKRNI